MPPFQERIIPARAGQTGKMALYSAMQTDHPRACGANKSVMPSFLGIVGSSPRVRGKHHQPAGVHARRRIIPARAGQTWWATRLYVVTPDHPRACGANV